MLQVKNLSFKYTEDLILKDIHFKLQPGEHLSITGESGSGKSTLLKLIYGEYDLNEGEIQWNKKTILGPKHNLVTGYDFIKYVAQEFDLMPYISVEESIGEFLSNFFPEKKQERVAELLEVVELTEFSKTKVKNLSGGQKQRVALARAIAKQPELILLDEPFSHIDNFKKQGLRRSLFNYLKDKKIACIVATHDKDDVLGYADKMLVLNQIKIVALDKPEELYKNPKSDLIASFFSEFSRIEDNLIYAHQLKLTTQSDLVVTVKKSYFKGYYYLIESIHNGKTLFFEHSEAISSGENVCLKIIK